MDRKHCVPDADLEDFVNKSDWDRKKGEYEPVYGHL